MVESALLVRELKQGIGQKGLPRGFRIYLPVDYSVWLCEMVIIGGVTDDRIVVTAMMVTFGDQKDRCGGSVYQHMHQK